MSRQMQREWESVSHYWDGCVTRRKNRKCSWETIERKTLLLKQIKQNLIWGIILFNFDKWNWVTTAWWRLLWGKCIYVVSVCVLLDFWKCKSVLLLEWCIMMYFFHCSSTFEWWTPNLSLWSHRKKLSEQLLIVFLFGWKPLDFIMKKLLILEGFITLISPNWFIYRTSAPAVRENIVTRWQAC